MKHYVFLTIAALLMSFASSAGNDNVRYNFLVNEIPDGYDMPLIGLINNAHGNQSNFQVGLINSNERNLVGLQVGFINSVGRDMQGIQVGFINSTEHDQFGIQTGFINSVENNFQGFEIGFINAIEDRIQGIQLGFINAVEKVDGFQIGFINAAENLSGFQVGFINAAERATGSQIGFLNATSRLEGLQLGFINRVDRIAKGMPVGFLSFVRHGGYKALEYAFNEFYPYNLSYKTGVEQFYTFPMLSYNPKLTHSWAIGFGAGSILPMNESVYFNPELTTQNVLSGDFEQLVSLGLNFGHAINEHANLLVGTSLVWNQTSTLVPQFSLRTWTIDATDQLHLGLRAALRYRF